MNATTPDVSPIALSLAAGNTAVLRLISQGPVTTTRADVARAAYVSPKNIERTFDNMEREGLIKAFAGDDVAPGGWEITDAGRHALAVADFAAGRLGAPPPEALPGPSNDVLLLAHHQLRANPLQPRKHFDPLELEQLKATIVATGDVIQNLVVFPLGDDGLHAISDGERRWRAVGELISEGVWPADRRLRAIQRDNTPGQAAFLGLVANGQQSKLTNMEQARAYVEIIADTGWSARRAALETGKDVKTVQEMVKVVREATADDIAAHEADPKARTWEWLRNTVKTPQEREEDGEGAEEQLDLEAVAEGTVYDPRPARQPVAAASGPANERDQRILAHMAALPADPDARTAVACDARDDYDHAMSAGNKAAAIDAAERYEAVVWANNGGAHFGSAEAERALADVLASVDGVAPKWGQRGLFLMDIEGVLVVVRAKGRLSHFIPGGDADLYAYDLDAPFFSNTGYRSAMGLNGACSFAEAVRRHVSWLMTQKDNRLKPMDPTYRENRERDQAEWAGLTPIDHAPEPQLAPPLELNARDRHMADYGKLVIGGNGSAAPPKPVKEPAGPDHSLNPVERVAMFELAHKSQAEADEGGWVQVREYWRDQAFSDLRDLGFLVATHTAGPGGPHAYLTNAGRAWVEANGGVPMNKGALTAIRQKADVSRDGDGYATPWLNVASTEDAAKALEASGGLQAAIEGDLAAIEGALDGDDEYSLAGSVLADVAKGLDDGDDFDPGPLFQQAGVLFPLQYDLRDQCIADATGEPILELTGHGDLVDDLLKARTLLFITLLNTAAADWCAQEPDHPQTQRADVLSAAVPIRRSITPDEIICLEDGARFVSITRHLQQVYGLSPDAYRERWSLPRDYPMVAPNQQKRRSDLMKVMGVEPPETVWPDEDADDQADA